MQASQIKTEYICKGTEKTIDIPSGLSLFPIDYYYGINSDSTCKNIRFVLDLLIFSQLMNKLFLYSAQDCRGPAQFTCTTQGSCKISLKTDIVVGDCNLTAASYIGITYRFIPCM